MANKSNSFIAALLSFAMFCTACADGGDSTAEPEPLARQTAATTEVENGNN